MDERQSGVRTALVAIVAGLTSAVAVSGLILGTGVGDDDEQPATVASAAAPAGGPSVRQVYDRAQRGIVRVDARPRGMRIPSGPPRRDDGVATGTGFVIDRSGLIVTNDHVAAGGPQVSVRFDEDDKRIDARIVGRDPSTDLALLKIDPGAAKFEPIALGDSKQVHVGDTAIAIGHPFGLERSLTLGVVSATDRDIEAPNGFEIDNVVQTDAAINPGNSGGPLLDAAGRVIGVNSQGRAGASGIAFAVPVDTVKKVLPDLRRGRRVERPFLGVATAGGSQPRVASVVRGGPAADAGVRRGDVIVSIDGRPVRSSADVVREVQRHRVGDRVAVVVRRGERRLELRVRLDARP
jgi:putative serine protease PepD